MKGSCVVLDTIKTKNSKKISHEFANYNFKIREFVAFIFLGVAFGPGFPQCAALASTPNARESSLIC
jgi:hypothetical protein